MSGKVVNLDPQKRLTQETLERLKKTVNNLDAATTDNFMIFYADKDGGANFEAYGVDWFLLGILQAYMNDLGRTMLHDDGSFSD